MTTAMWWVVLSGAVVLVFALGGVVWARRARNGSSAKVISRASPRQASQHPQQMHQGSQQASQRQPAGTQARPKSKVSVPVPEVRSGAATGRPGSAQGRRDPGPRADQKAAPSHQTSAPTEERSWVPDRLRATLSRKDRTGTQALVHPLVLGSTVGVAQPETRLPTKVILESKWGSGFFHGFCGPANEMRFVVRGAAVRGIGHARNGMPGQDVAGAMWDENRQSLLVTVADGLGSLPNSDRVALLVATDALRVPGSHLDQKSELSARAHLIFRDIADNTERTMTGEGLNGASTLVVAEIRPAPRNGGAYVTVCGVGDSEAWYLTDGRWHVLHHERGHREENATRQLPGYTDPRILENIPVASGSVLLLGTDGFASALGSETASPLSRELAGRWRKTPPPLEFLTHVDFVEDGRVDDRAVVAVWVS